MATAGTDQCDDPCDDRCLISLNGVLDCPDKKVYMCPQKMKALKFPCTTTADQLIAQVNGLPVDNIVVGQPLNMGNDGWVLLIRYPAP